MPTNFPSSPDDIQNDVSNSTLEVDLHPGLHNQLADAVMAVQTELLAGGTMNLAAHVAAADPHAVYLTQTEGDARYTTIAGGIPDGSITSAKIADGAVTSAKILDGTIATIDLADAAVTNAKLASDTARANLLTNGGFEIWQRGNGPFTTHAGYTADRWYMENDGGGTGSVSRDTGNVDVGSTACAAFTLSGAGGWSLRQGVESAAIRGRAVTTSIRVKTSTPNAVRLIGPGGTSSPLHSGSGTYETLSVTETIAASPAAVLVVRIASVLASTAYLDNAMLVVGSVAADYAPLHPADDLARCLRYYEVIQATGNLLVSPGQATSTTVAMGHLRYAVAKPVTPTITNSAATDFAVLNAGGALLTATAFSALLSDTRATALNVTVASGLVAGNAAGIFTASAGSTAKLSVEANP